MINKLVEKIKKTGAPIVVGLDPMLNYIPQHVQDKAFSEYGETLEGAAEAIWQFNKEIVDKTYDLIPAVKPQIAMYEQLAFRESRLSRRQWTTASQRIWWSLEISREGYRFYIRGVCGWASRESKGREQRVCSFR